MSKVRSLENGRAASQRDIGANSEDVNITQEGSDVESAASLPVKPGWSTLPNRGYRGTAHHAHGGHVDRLEQAHTKDKQHSRRCTAPSRRMPTRTPSTPQCHAQVSFKIWGMQTRTSYPRSQARRAWGHALGARYVAVSMIPGMGIFRDRLRRFEGTRSGSVILGGIIRLVSIAILSVSSWMLSTWEQLNA